MPLHAVFCCDHLGIILSLLAAGFDFPLCQGDGLRPKSLSAVGCRELSPCWRIFLQPDLHKRVPLEFNRSSHCDYVAGFGVSSPFNLPPLPKTPVSLHMAACLLFIIFATLWLVLTHDISLVSVQTERVVRPWIQKM